MSSIRTLVCKIAKVNGEILTEAVHIFARSHELGISISNGVIKLEIPMQGSTGHKSFIIYADQHRRLVVEGDDYMSTMSLEALKGWIEGMYKGVAMTKALKSIGYSSSVRTSSGGQDTILIEAVK